MKKILILSLTAFLFISCGKELINEELPDDQKESITEKEMEPVASDTTQSIAKEIIKEEEPEVVEPEEVKEESVILVEKEEPAPTIEEKVLIDEPQITAMDSVEVFYMIRPNDYLVKIAINEYGRPTMWRNIWKWNYDSIGDNPDRIYPYRELSLKKPVEYAVKTEFTYYDYIVKEDDTLWSIAKGEYDNNLAWIVILRDNYDEISDTYNDLDAGTVLKLRSKLY